MLSNINNYKTPLYYYFIPYLIIGAKLTEYRVDNIFRAREATASRFMCRPAS